MTAKTGLFGTSESFVPLQGANVDGKNMVVPYDKVAVEEAPRFEENGHLAADEQVRKEKIDIEGKDGNNNRR